jgi:hypothetical protein
VIRPIEISVASETELELSREEYEFLQNFKRPKYQRSLLLEKKSDYELLEMLRRLLKQKVRKCKYKEGLLLKKIEKEINECQQLLQRGESTP